MGRMTALVAGVLLAALTSCADGSPDPEVTSPDQGAEPIATESEVDGQGSEPSEGTEQTEVAEGPAAVPSHAWPLDGDGEPAAGDVTLSFDGSVELADGAAVFDGASGFASTAASGPIDTTASFSVAALVSLHPSAFEGRAEYATAVSQLGEVAAAFFLGVGEGNWSFAMKDADTNEPGHTLRASATPAEPDPDLWVHLVGVYDHDTGELRFYLDGEPVAVEPFTASWQADGPLTIGRAQAHGSAADFWPGAITDVQVFTTALGDDEVARLTDGTRPATPPPAMPIATSDAALPDGTYEYTFSDEEKAVVESLFTAAEAAAAGGFDGEVKTSMRFEDGKWLQFFTFDGVVFTVNGQPEGSGGVYRVEDDRLTTTDPGGDIVYRWSLDGDTLSLELLELYDPEERDIVALITEHDYTRVTP
jgi:hypothetical protein